MSYSSVINHIQPLGSDEKNDDFLLEYDIYNYSLLLLIYIVKGVYYFFTGDNIKKPKIDVKEYAKY